MQLAVQFATFIASAYIIALLAWSVLPLFGFRRWGAFGIGTVVMVTPLILPFQYVMLRSLACVLAVDLSFKVVDYAGQRKKRACADRTFVSYAKFLVPFPVFLVRFGQQPRGSQFDVSHWLQTALALIGFGLCHALLEPLSQVPILRTSFLLDHTVKFILFTVAIELLARFVHGLERAAGYNTVPLIDSAFLSETVGEFWCRYNTRVHSWFDCNVFRALRGMRSPVQVVFLTFFLSAVIHEYGFTIATSRCHGYQFAFFMIQAPAVILGRVGQRVAETPIRRVALRSSTIIWMWATSMLFFHGVNQVFPVFYASDPWLP